MTYVGSKGARIPGLTRLTGMEPPRRRLQHLITSWCLLLATGPFPFVALRAQAPGASQTLNASDISQRMADRNARRKAALQQYESRRVITVTYDGPLNQGEATETVQMHFTAPDTKQFTVVSATGIKLIRDSVFQRALDAEQAATAEQVQRASALNTENYSMKVVGVEDLPAGRCYVLDVAPKSPGEFTYVGRAWVQATDFAIVRIQGRPAVTPSQWVSDGEFTTDFQKVGNFYFPQQTVSTSQLPLGMRARLTIQYGPYRILSASTP